MRYQGRITRWNDERGFGYITPNGGGDDVFVHVRALSRWRARRPAGGEIVTYSKASDARGRPCAVAVRRVDRRPARTAARSPSSGPWGWWLLGGFSAALVAAVLLGRLPVAVPAACAVISVLTFALYAHDKSAARAGRWRTPEQTLHLLALAGGWPGALIAQQLLRHKSSKASFRGVFWVTVAANVALVLWLASARGAALLASVFSG